MNNSAISFSLLRMIDLESLKIFRTVVDEGGCPCGEQAQSRQSNVTKRSTSWKNISHPAVFAARGAPYVSREGQTCSPTQIVCCAWRMRRLANCAPQAVRVIRLGALESTAGSRLAPILSRYHSLYPDVSMELATERRRHS